MNLQKVIDMLYFEEGFRSRPYLCSEGYPTVGIGQRIGCIGDSLSSYDFLMPLPVAKLWCESNVRGIHDTMKKIAWYNQLNEDRKAIILSMAYQMGIGKVFLFKRMIIAIKEGNWPEAKKEMLDSKWARQTSKRANRHAEVMVRGNFLPRDFGKVIESAN